MVREMKNEMFLDLEKLIRKSNDFRGVTSPNPPVAAIAFDVQGNVLGTAFHERAGTEHAEAKLLRILKEQSKLLQIATLFITLEPCNHTGRTPPCTKAILDAIEEIKSSRENGGHFETRNANESCNYDKFSPFTVIYAQSDPNPNVAGLGAEKLRQAGITVIQGFDTYFAQNDSNGTNLGTRPKDIQKMALEALAPFSKWIQTGIPYVTVKIALRDDSDNGPNNNAKKVANHNHNESLMAVSESDIMNLRLENMIPPPGSKTFSRPESLLLAHQIRRRSNAIMTGTGTITADLPEFTVRHLKDHEPPLKRELVIMTKNESDSLDRRNPVITEYITKTSQNGFNVTIGSNIEGELRRLGKIGCLEVLVEAGPKLTKSILDQGLYDEVLVITVTKGADYVYRYCNPILPRSNGS